MSQNAIIDARPAPDTPRQGGSEYTYGGGRAMQTFRQNPAAVHAVVLSALDDLRIQSVKQIAAAGASSSKGVTADNRRRPH